MAVVGVETLAGGRKVAHPVLETFILTLPDELAPPGLQGWQDFTRVESFPVTWESKKGPRTLDAKSIVTAVAVTGPAAVRFTCNFAETYVSPLRLVEAVCPQLVRGAYALAKTGVAFCRGRRLAA
ncbi:hypothetical protein DVDV_2106 [Desulfovibrio sp. DV]|nr:hypothetical protein DVDV_2106 [Desulfovibrio sp. DV]